MFVSTKNIVTNNNSFKNTRDGILVNNSDSNDLNQNTLRANGFSGIKVLANSSNNLIKKNVAISNFEYGYDDFTGGSGVNTFEKNKCIVNALGGSNPTGLCIPQP